MYGKAAMISFKYQMYLYGSEAITYLNAIHWLVTEPALWVIPHPYRQPYNPLYGSITFTDLEGNSSMSKLQYLYKKAKGKTVCLRNHHMENNCP
jgi:hypothetical protein